MSRSEHLRTLNLAQLDALADALEMPYGDLVSQVLAAAQGKRAIVMIAQQEACRSSV